MVQSGAQLLICQRLDGEKKVQKCWFRQNVHGPRVRHLWFRVRVLTAVLFVLSAFCVASQ